MDVTLFKRPSALMPLAMSLAALAIVIGYAATFGTARQPDEGAAAHLWQLFMALQRETADDKNFHVVSAIGPSAEGGFTEQSERPACDPGATVKLSCAVGASAAAQVVRVCETSAVLGTGVACSYHDALGSAVVTGTSEATFTCPGARSPTEPGARFALGRSARGRGGCHCD